MNAALRRFSRRQIRTRPARAFLTLFSIVLGVAAISAVEMLSVSIRGASKNLFSTVTGKADLVVQAAADAPLEETLLPKIEGIEGVRAAVPAIQGNVTIFTGHGENNAKTRGMGLSNSTNWADHCVASDHQRRTGLAADVSACLAILQPDLTSGSVA